MRTKRYVWAEIEAFHLFKPHESLTTDSADFHVYGNRVIELAERIKAQRAVAAMED